MLVVLSWDWQTYFAFLKILFNYLEMILDQNL